MDPSGDLDGGLQLRLADQPQPCDEVVIWGELQAPPRIPPEQRIQTVALASSPLRAKPLP